MYGVLTGTFNVAPLPAFLVLFVLSSKLHVGGYRPRHGVSEEPLDGQTRCRRQEQEYYHISQPANIEAPDERKLDVGFVARAGAERLQYDKM